MRARARGGLLARGMAVALVTAAACVPASTTSTTSRSAERAVPISQSRPCCADIERGLLAQLNAARTDPRGFAARLESRLPHFRGVLFQRPGDAVATRTHEGTAAVREAIAALRATAPLPAVRLSEGMSRGARDLVLDQGPRGAMGHTGSDGSTSAGRVNRHGRWGGRLNESISYGPATAHDVIADLLIDDGVSNRGHRRNLFDPGVRVAGLSCGRHSAYRVMCVIVLAGEYTEAAGS